MATQTTTRRTATAKATATKAARPQERMHLHIVNTDLGLYTCSSATWGDWLLYQVDVKHSTCTCEAGKHGRLCKHLKLSRALYQATMDARTAAARQAQKAATNAATAKASTGYGSLADAFAS